MRTDRRSVFFFLHVAIRNSLRSNNKKQLCFCAQQLLPILVICKGLVPTLLIRDIGIQRTWSMAHPNLSTLGSLKWGYLHSSISFAIRHNQRTCISNRIVVFHKNIVIYFRRYKTYVKADQTTLQPKGPLEIILITITKAF